MKITFIVRQELLALLLYLSECMKLFYNRKAHHLCYWY